MGRVTDIEVGSWNKVDLFKVIRNGEEKLWITINDEFSNYIINNCFGSVFIVQEACNRLCERNGVFETQSSRIRIGSRQDAETIVHEIYNEQSSRYKQFLDNFEGFKSSDISSSNDVRDYRTLMEIILKTDIDELLRGVGIESIMAARENKYPSDSKGHKSMRNALYSLSANQSMMGIKPTIMIYDSNKSSLVIVDKLFLFWLSRSNRAMLLKEYGLSLSTRGEMNKNQSARELQKRRRNKF